MPFRTVKNEYRRASQVRLDPIIARFEEYKRTVKNEYRRVSRVRWDPIIARFEEYKLRD